MALSFSHAILEWARTKPADEAYDYTDSNRCAVAQFGAETGFPGLRGLLSHELMAKSAAVEDAAVSRPQTFGAFADRLEQALAQ